jgi:hypothetical protein
MTLGVMVLMTSLPQYEPGQLLRSARVFEQGVTNLAEFTRQIQGILLLGAFGLPSLAVYLKLAEWELLGAAYYNNVPEDTEGSNNSQGDSNGDSSDNDRENNDPRPKIQNLPRYVKKN